LHFFKESLEENIQKFHPMQTLSAFDSHQQQLNPAVSAPEDIHTSHTRPKPLFPHGLPEQ